MPAGLLLLPIARRLPRGVWIYRTAALGALNFSLFWSLLFVAAYRLPGVWPPRLGSASSPP